MVNWGFIFKLIIRKYEERKAEDSEITQKKANELEENDPIEIGKTMSIILVFTFNILFFAPIIPGLVIIGIIGIIVLYWVMKYLMISRQIVKYALSSKLVITATEFIKVGILANAIMAFYFYSRLLNRLSIPATIQLTISLIFFVVPIKRIIIKRYYTKEGEEDFRKFEEVSAGLRHYDVTNPVTRSLGFSRLEGKRFQDIIRRCIIKKLKNSVAQGGGLEVWEDADTNTFGMGNIGLLVDMQKKDNIESIKKNLIRDAVEASSHSSSSDSFSEDNYDNSSSIE